MIDLTGCVSIPYFKKTVFTGSDGKMRYLLGKAEENEETVLKAWYWEGPYASMYVPEEKKTVEQTALQLPKRPLQTMKLLF